MLSAFRENSTSHDECHQTAHQINNGKYLGLKALEVR